MPRPDDLRAAARLAADAAGGVVDVAEAAHAVIARPWRRSGRTRGLTGLVYRAVRAGLGGAGRLADAALAVVAPGAPSDALAGGLRPRSARRQAVVAALNGVCGDALAERGSALATPFQLRHDGRPLRLAPDALRQSVPAPSDTVLVAVHGICMHDGQWGDAGHDPVAALADGLGATAVAVRYNSGRHVWENGRDLADALDALADGWPRPVRRLVVVGHSMGGLVARSALAAGVEAGHRWPGLGVSVVTLGTPHHGAVLERAGNALDAALAATRWTAPFARIGQVRSAGVTDLRWGVVRRGDGRGRFEPGADPRPPTPVPAGVALYAVAATTGDGTGGWRDQAVGDGLVGLDSALGRHPDPGLDLGVPAGRQWVALGMTHFDLIRRPEVTARLLAWLAPPADGASGADGAPAETASGAG